MWFCHLAIEQHVSVLEAVGKEKQLRDCIFCFDAEDDGHRNKMQPQESQRVSNPEQLAQLKVEQGKMRSVLFLRTVGLLPGKIRLIFM